MDSYLIAFRAIADWHNIILMLIGVVIGVVVGILPGIGAVQAMALLIPLTWKMDIIPDFILLVSIYATS